VAVWKIALENVTVSPATIVTFPGKNWFSVAPFGTPVTPGHGAPKPHGTCSPRNTL
jgi:hypothetical protein